MNKIWAIVIVVLVVIMVVHSVLGEYEGVAAQAAQASLSDIDQFILEQVAAEDIPGLAVVVT